LIPVSPYSWLKWLHILSSTVLFGTGIGSAFYMLVTSLARDARAVAHVVRWVVIADWLFTTPTVILQPLTGLLLLGELGLSPSDWWSLAWIRWSVILYGVAGAAWLPVVWMQIRMRDMAREAAAAGAALPPRYFRMLAWWVALGFVAFGALVMVFLLMVAKPS
jgi:uncharacterized membrane protein